MSLSTARVLAFVAAALLSLNYCRVYANSADFPFDEREDRADLMHSESTFGYSQVENADADKNKNNDTNGAGFLVWQRQTFDSAYLAPKPATICLALPFIYSMMARRNRQKIPLRIDKTHVVARLSHRILTIPSKQRCESINL